MPQASQKVQNDHFRGKIVVEMVADQWQDHNIVVETLNHVGVWVILNSN